MTDITRAGVWGNPRAQYFVMWKLILGSGINEAKLKSQSQSHILINESVVTPGEKTRKILIVESFSKELNID